MGSGSSAEEGAASIAIHGVTPATVDGALEALGSAAATYARACGFKAEPGEMLLVPAPDGAIAAVLFGVEAADAKRRDPFLAGKLATLLPDGTYTLADGFEDPFLAALAFERAGYRFTRFRKGGATQPRLAAPATVDGKRVKLIADAIALGRDLINRPANDLGPEALETAVRDLAEAHGARFQAIRGDDLLARGFPLIHAVGRASAEAPRLAEFSWGDAGAPKVTLVGKGVCFDTGGLDIKPSSGMLLMKKDMGGAATRAGARRHDHGRRSAGAPAGDRADRRECNRRQRLSPRRHSPEAARDRRSRSATPTRKAA